MKKTFKRFIAGLSCIAMLSTVSALNVSATITSNVYDDIIGSVFGVPYGETIDITLNNGETFSLYSWDYVLRNDDGEIVGYTTSSLGERSYTIFKGELYNGLFIFDDNDNLINTYQFGDNLQERYPEYNLPPKGEGYRLDMVIFDLDGNYVGYEVVQNAFNEDGVPLKEITLLNGETVPVPEGKNTLRSRFDTDGTLLYYQWGNSSMPCISNDDNSTIGDSDSGDNDVEVGDSNNLYDTPTGIRGDVNYDGKVNVIDVMTLRRYLLHLLEW